MAAAAFGCKDFLLQNEWYYFKSDTVGIFPVELPCAGFGGLFFVNRVFVLYGEFQDSSELEAFAAGAKNGGSANGNGNYGSVGGSGSGAGEVVLLVVADKAGVANGFEEKLKALQARAESLKSLLASNGVECRVLLEWGSCRDAALACSQRENAIILNKELV